jgi:hypothetical protein
LGIKRPDASPSGRLMLLREVPDTRFSLRAEERKRGRVLTNIPPPDFHQLPYYIWVWILSRLTSTSRVKTIVSDFFDVLSHIRSKYRKFKESE